MNLSRTAARPLWLLTATLLFGAVAVVLSGEPGALRELLDGTRFLGEAETDAWGTQWFYWWVDGRVAAGSGFGSTDLFFYPWGKDVLAHTGANVLDAVLSVPFRRVFGPVVGYNLFCVGVLVANGASAWSLARAVGASTAGSAAAAACLAINPFSLHELRHGRPTQALLAFAVYFLAELIHASGGRTPAWRAGLWLGVTALGYWFHGLFAAAIGVVLAGEAAAGSPEGRGAALRAAVIVAAVAALVASPGLVPLLLAFGEAPGMLDDSAFAAEGWLPITREGFQMGLHVLAPLRAEAGLLFATDGEPRFVATGPVLAAAMLVPAALGAWQRGRRVALAVAAVALIVLACGPQVVLPGGLFADPAYGWLVDAVAPLRRLWWPVRAVGVATGALAALVALGVDAFAPRLRGLAGAVTVLGLVAESWARSVVPLPSWDAAVDPAYHCLARGESGAVLELPTPGSQRHVYEQTIHGHPTFGGMLDGNPVLVPEVQREFARRNGFVAELRRLADGGAGPLPADQPTDATSADRTSFEQGRSAMGELGYRYIVLDRRAASDGAPPEEAPRARAVRRGLIAKLGAPVFDGSETTIWMPWGGRFPCSEP